jgi:hypothetical protein
MTDADEEQDRDIEMVKGHCARLAEHFDAVQIFVTRPSEDGTVTCQWGSGNWYARYGQVKAWVIGEEKEFGRRRDNDD